MRKVIVKIRNTNNEIRGMVVDANNRRILHVTDPCTYNVEAIDSAVSYAANRRWDVVETREF